MKPEKAKRAYPELEESIRRAFQAHDPDGLFAMGAPADEHDTDIHAIISSLQHAAGAEDVAATLRHRFEGGDSVDRLTAMAAEIWQAWRDFKRAAG